MSAGIDSPQTVALYCVLDGILSIFLKNFLSISTVPYHAPKILILVFVGKSLVEETKGLSKVLIKSHTSAAY